MPAAVTVLMPVYNAEKYLKEAIESILNQTFVDFELLVIDDASQDNSVQIIRSFKDERIRLIINQQNLGVSATLNKGIANSSTELVARMDADDICYPMRLERQVEYFANNPRTVLLSTSVRVITSDKKLVEEYRVNHFHNCYNLNFICPIYHPTVMFKRSPIMSLKGYTYKFSEDFDLWWRVSREFKIDHIDEILLDYRLSSISISNVTLKPDYDESGRELMLRNLRYYAGPEFELTFNEAETFRNVFEPLCSSGHVRDKVRCIKKLEHINKLILQQTNLNYSGPDLLPYATDKKEYTLKYLYDSLSPAKRFLFLIFYGKGSFMFKKVKHKWSKLFS